MKKPTKYLFTPYSLGFRVGKAVTDKKYSVRTPRYKGRGRPRKTDYDLLTMLELIEKAKITVEEHTFSILKSII